MTLPVPTQRTWTTSDIVTAAMMNANVRDAVKFLENPPLFLGTSAAVQSVPAAVFTSIAFDTNTIDTYGGHSTTVNNSRYTAVVAGYYFCSGVVAFAPNATGNRFVEFAKNSAALVPDIRVNATTGGWATHIGLANLVQLNVGDYLELQGWQNSGGALNTESNASYLQMQWVHA